MSNQQVTGVAVLLRGVAALIFSAGVAWTLSRLSRTRRVEGTAFITVVSFLLFVVGIVLYCFGVSAIVEGRR
jgi:Kef-type K+ transport system membrane component KefB